MTPSAQAQALPQEFEMVSLDRVTPHPRNARIGAVSVIEESVDENGFYGACVVQRSTGHVLVGNHRYRMAASRGLPAIPVLWVDVDDERALKILLVDNRSSDRGTNNPETLAELLMDLSPNLLGTGYDEQDLQQLIAPDVPNFNPNLDPQLGNKTYTSDDMGKTNINPDLSGRNLIQVMCPGCGNEFFIDANDLQENPKWK